MVYGMAYGMRWYMVDGIWFMVLYMVGGIWYMVWYGMYVCGGRLGKPIVSKSVI